MNIQQFLRQTIHLGIEAACKDYAEPDKALKLEGALKGFYECLDQTPAEIAQLLFHAGNDTHNKARAQAPDYWYWRCREAEIEWVANVLSAFLMNDGLPPIMTPTYRGVMMAARILDGEKQA